MNKKSLYSILSAIVLMIVASVSLVLTVGHNASAYTQHDRILVLDDWDDFAFRSYGDYLGGTNYDWFHREENDDVVCYRFSDEVGQDLFLLEFDGCGFKGDNRDLEYYDEVRIVFPDGIEVIDGQVMFYSDVGLGDKITFVKIPESVKLVGSEFAGFLTKARVYCECSELFATEHWMEDWDKYWDSNLHKYVKLTECGRVIWNCNRTIIFDTDSGNEVAEQTVCVDSLVTKPTAPTKDGYEFKGWFIGDEEYDFATSVTEDVTLTAKWEAVQAQPEPTEPETPADENGNGVNNKNNNSLIWGITGSSAGVLIFIGVVIGLVISKRRRK